MYSCSSLKYQQITALLMFRILIAEDDINFGKVLKSELESAGCRVDLAKDGVEAVISYLCKGQDYTLIVLDDRMPRLRGVDAFRILKTFDPEAKVILFSGHADREYMESLKEEGAADFLRKPFAVPELKNIIDDIAKRT